MAEIYRVHFGILQEGELPSDISEIQTDWQNTFKGKASKIITNLQRVIPDESAYNDKIVDRGNAGYTDFLGSDHPRLNKILLKRKVKMPKAASDYLTNRDAAFEAGGAFETGVDGAATRFLNNLKVILRVVGDKDKIVGAVPKLTLALQGRASLLADLIDETRDHVVTSTELKEFFIDKKFVTPAVSLVNECLSYVVYATDSGYDDTWIETNIVTNYNTLLQAMVNASMVNSELDPTACAIEIKKDPTTGRWGVELVEATPSA